MPFTEVVASLPEFEHIVLVTNLTTDRVGLTDLYLQRADSENAYDELRNQWGWGGFRLLSGVERSSGRTEKTADDAQLGVRIIRRRTIVRE